MDYQLYWNFMKNSHLKRLELPKWSNLSKLIVICKFKKELVNIQSFYNQFGIKTETQKSVFQFLHSEKLPKPSKVSQLDKQPWILTCEALKCLKKWISIMSNIWLRMIKTIESKDKLSSVQVNNMQQLLLKKKENKLLNLNRYNHKMLLERKKSTLWMMMISLTQLLVLLHNLFKFQLLKLLKFNNKILLDC